MIKGYRLSFILAGILAIAAFVEQYAVKAGKRPLVNASFKDAPLVLFTGSMVLIFVGWLEYMRQEKKKTK